ncbi:extracellular solute-binding protein family 5 [Salinarchaeum sp. Harcht-Bsk1]|uniref:ABC transporter substrate-binding protein n=1 Tax=Salinarchaeum sp. Harcht-Bsk1 TaxID=1333523 RepID=UPI00034237C8|nr:ABC transporter substrate-binding protein [Salinarchaeum sp. Harcht-Bsk1]AGN02311.1 extracellular solute-binding protein family 5 [Salinarchaeum sp. Harcht-Bsk1]
MPSTGLSRRSLLTAASGGAAAATAGCFSRLRSQITYDAADPISLSVKTVPADRDPSAVLLGRELADHLETVGIDVSHDLIDEVQLLRDAFFNHDYDLFVTEIPGHRDPDELRALLHSQFAPELGMQNPFGYASPRTDDLLEAQRRPATGTDDPASDNPASDNLATDDRAMLVERLQRQLLEQQPFLTVVSRPHTTAVASDLTFSGGVSFASSLAYLTVDRPEGDLDTLTVGLQRPNVTRNRNVLAVEYRLHDRLTDLLYDPIVQRVGDQYVPWLAAEYSVHGQSNTITVDLRPNLSWHDGTPLTASDVAFTYRFCKDTALGGTDSPVPAPRFRQQTSLVRSVSDVDQTTVEIELHPTRVGLAPTALTVPVLPEHVWNSRSSLQHEYFTRAITASVSSPVGSGPLRFDSAEEGQSLTLQRFDDHFLRTTSDLPNALQPFAGGPAYETLSAESAPNIGVVLDDIAEGRVQVLDGTVPVDDVPDARDRSDVRVLESPTPSYYLIGINTRRHPLSNYAFRSALGRLIDRDHVVEAVFDGIAMATETPLHDTAYVSEELRWDGESVTGGFPGEDGQLDRDAARQLFRDAGFRYQEGSLRGR